MIVEAKNGLPSHDANKWSIQDLHRSANFQPTIEHSKRISLEATMALRQIRCRKERVAATTLIQGNCRTELTKIETASVDAVITDPIYAEINRPYGRISESDWHTLMREVVLEIRRILKPTGSAVMILQPNYEQLGRMRLWLWEFMCWAGREWNLVQDAYWWANNAMPVAGADRKHGLMRPSVKMCLWLGNADCYRNQDRVLLPPARSTITRSRYDNKVRIGPSGRMSCGQSFLKTAEERAGVTPFNLLAIPVGVEDGSSEDHPAVTPYRLAEWWCRYILPPGGVLLDPFVGSGTMLAAALDNGASKVIGIDKEQRYLEIAKRRIQNIRSNHMRQRNKTTVTHASVLSTDASSYA